MYQTDRHGNLTDDADRWLSGQENTFEYDPAPDFDGMDYDDYRSGPKCGGVNIVDDGREGVNVGCPGCRHCFPPDAECIPTGFEVYDRPDFYRVRQELWMLAEMGYALQPRDTDAGRVYFERAIGFDRRMRHAARFKLDRICERAETHSEAVEKYTEWAKRAVTVRYRDEPKPAVAVTQRKRRVAA